MIKYTLVLGRYGETQLQKIVGYHGTKSENVDSILKEGFKIKKSKKGDNHWLGHGIYFYSDYELADWWAQTKVKKHNQKYGENNVAAVIRAVIKADNILDLDSPFALKKFKEYQEELEKQIVEQGIVLDFTQGKGKISERIRCFWLDAVKQEYNIQVIIYTFTQNNPSYVDSKYHIYSQDGYSLNSMGLAYHEKQICVTENALIVNVNSIDNSGEEFDEVII